LTIESFTRHHKPNHCPQLLAFFRRRCTVNVDRFVRHCEWVDRQPAADKLLRQQGAYLDKREPSTEGGGIPLTIAREIIEASYRVLYACTARQLYACTARQSPMAV